MGNKNKKEDIKETNRDANTEAVEDETVQDGPDQGAEPEKSEQELLQEKFDELNDRYLRLMAEYDNFRKRTQKEKDDIYPSATAAAILKFLPVMDSFERAAQFEYATEEFAKGFDMMMQNFKDIIASFGVEEVGEVGEPFNPAFHNAAMHIEDENLGENVVSQVFQKGYKIGDRVIRFAMVQTAN
ncbi:MAG: nucleotide exchange factor GrpE [Oscillospiraceae bacterium]|jgi:molecular chaperone GrpE|nr:nucleotide exchange factor GrpE [Oscillospiraceae bacterium]